MRRPLAVLGLLVALAGCTAPDVSTTIPTEPTSTTAPVAQAPVPTGLEIPSIGVATTTELVALRLDDEQHLEVPDITRPDLAGWFKGGVRPGEPGPAVIAAHVNGSGRPGLFARLDELQPGADVHVVREDGSRVTFRVDRVAHYDKDAYPTAEVYGDTPDPQLRLITCGGEFDRAAESYTQNTVAYASYVSTSAPLSR